MTGQGRAPADLEDLWRPRHWRDHVGGKSLDGFFLGVVLVAFSWGVVANLWLPSAAWIAANCAFAIVLLAAALRAGLSLDELGMRRDYAVRGLVVGTVAAVVIVAVLTIAVAFPATRGYFDDPHIAKDADSARVFNILVRIPFGTVVVEELLFRGVLLALALRRWTVATAVLVTSALFGLWHIVPASESAGGGTASTLGAIVGTVAVTTAAGVLFAWLRLRANSIVAPMLAHAATNSLAYLAVVIALQLH
jgi:membrane protease YdiL (CAAX protease family)